MKYELQKNVNNKKNKREHRQNKTQQGNQINERNDTNTQPKKKLQNGATGWKMRKSRNKKKMVEPEK